VLKFFRFPSEYKFLHKHRLANYLPSNGHYYQFIPSIGIPWTTAKKYLPQLFLYGLQRIFSYITAADEAISGEQAEELDGLVEVMQRMKEFGNGLQVLKGLRMVEQEQLSGMD
jgi:hypothetical protein